MLKISIENDSLIVIIQELNYDKIILKLFRDRNIILTKEIFNSSFLYILNKPGIYYSEIDIYKNGKIVNKERSNTISYFTDEYKLELDQQLKKINPQPYNLIYSYFSYPNLDFALVNKKVEISGFTVTNLNKYYYIITRKEDNIIYKNSVILSGTLISEDYEYIYGVNDLKGNDIEKYKDCLGDYNLIIKEDNAIYCSNDYHGQGKLYYYCIGETVIVSNRLHLLLITMKEIGIDIKLNEKKALTMLMLRFYDTIINNFTSETLIENVFSTIIGEYIVLNENGLYLKKTKGYYDFNLSPAKKVDDNYNILIKQGKQEIINNIKSIINSPRNKKIVCEVSGGMDSRVTFCALTNNHRNKNIYVSTEKNNKYKNDYRIGLELNSFYKFPYFPINEYKYENNDKDFISYVLDQKYYYSLNNCKKINYRTCEDTLILNGTYGESCLRLRYGIIIRKFCKRCNSIYDLCKNLIDFYYKPSFIVNSQDYENYLFKFILDELCKESGLNEYDYITQEKLINIFENYFLNFTHSLHARPASMSEFQLRNFAPIKSKSMIKAHRLYAAINEDFYLGFDLTKQLNPLLTSIPYETEDYNIAYEEYKKNKEDWIPEICKIDISIVEQTYNESQKNKNNDYFSKKCYAIDFNNILSMMKYVVESSSQFSEIKYNLYHFILEHKNNKWELEVIFFKLAFISSILTYKNIEKDDDSLILLFGKLDGICDTKKDIIKDVLNITDNDRRKLLETIKNKSELSIIITQAIDNLNKDFLKDILNAFKNKINLLYCIDFNDKITLPEELSKYHNINVKIILENFDGTLDCPLYDWIITHQYENFNSCEFYNSLKKISKTTKNFIDILEDNRKSIQNLDLKIFYDNSTSINNRFIFKYGRLVSIFNTPMDWAQNPYDMSNWMHNLNKLDFLVKLTDNSIINIIKDYISFNSEHSNMYFKYDHTVTERILNISNIIKKTLSQEVKDICQKLLKEDVSKLLDDKIYKMGNNHALMADIALLTLQNEHPNIINSEIQKNVLQRSLKNYKLLFSNNAIAKEHSITYQEWDCLYALKYLAILKKSQEYQEFANKEEEKLINATKLLLASFIKEDNTYFPVGDSSRWPILNQLPFFDKNLTPYENLKPYFIYGVQYWEEGFSAYRNKNGIQAIFTCGHFSNFHKHNDELTFCFSVNGQTILDEVGYSGYLGGKRGLVLLDEENHSTICIKNKKWTNNIDRFSKNFPPSEKYDFYGKHNRIDGYEISRGIKFIDKKETFLIKIHDSIENFEKKEKETIYIGKFIFNPNIKLISKCNYIYIYYKENLIGHLIFQKSIKFELIEVPYIGANARVLNKTTAVKFFSQKNNLYYYFKINSDYSKKLDTASL